MGIDVEPGSGVHIPSESLSISTGIIGDQTKIEASLTSYGVPRLGHAVKYTPLFVRE